MLEHLTGNRKIVAIIVVIIVATIVTKGGHKGGPQAELMFGGTRLVESASFIIGAPAG